MITIEIDDLWHADVVQDHVGCYHYIVFKVDEERLRGEFTPAGNILAEDQLKIHLARRIREYVLHAIDVATAASTHRHPPVRNILMRIDARSNAIACEDPSLLDLVPTSYEFATVNYPGNHGRFYMFNDSWPVIIVFHFIDHMPVLLIAEENRLILK